MKITYFQNTDGACDYYRAVLPMETARQKGHALTKKIFSDSMIGFYSTNRAKFDQLMQCDLYLTQRIGSISFVKTLRNYISDYKSNAKIVMDFDDNVFKVSPLSNHYKDYGVHDLKIKFPDGSEHWAWKDGENGFDIARNQKMMDEIKDNLSSVDMVTTTTEILADVFREYNPNVRVLPNCVDLNIMRKVPVVKNHSEVRMFWAGGQSHWEDFLLLREPLREIFDKYKNVRLVIMGWMAPGIKEEFGDRVEFIDWVDTVAYPFLLRSLDIDFAVIPLKDSEFNRCKSPIKWVEMGALEVPSVASLVSPYQEMVGLSNEDNGVYISGNDPHAWVKGISHLIDNPDARRQMGLSARKVVEQNFDINTQYHQWVNAYEELLCQSLAPQR